MSQNNQNWNYYNYLKKYSPRFLVKQESWTHQMWSRGSSFLQLVNFKGTLTMTNRTFIFPGYRIKSLFFFVGGLVCCIDIWGLWYFQEIYNKYTTHKWTNYQPWMHSSLLEYHNSFIVDPCEEKKPFTRLKYQDRVKIVYDGYETPDVIAQRRYRYR